MKRFLFAIILVLLLASISYGQVAYEAKTIADTAVGLTASTYGRADWAMCRLETAEIRYTLDGATTPTSTVGVPLEAFEWLVLGTPGEIKNFSAIRTGGTSGALKCHYFRN